MEAIPQAALTIDDCWNRIGVWSQAAERCPQLETHVHCRNCPVFATAARRIFEGRPLPPDYLEEWRRHYAAPPPPKKQVGHLSVMVFRVGGEFLSLPIGCVDEVCPPEMVHRLPHYASLALQGIVNIHGQLRLCFCLSALLGIEAKRLDESQLRRRVFPRLMVVRHQDSHFALSVDEVLGARRFAHEDLLPVPSSLAHALSKFTSGLLRDGQESVGLLDEELLFQAMGDSLQ